jgi:hypothetical protein
VAPVTVLTGRNAKQGTFTPAEFTMDWTAGVATCMVTPARTQGD